MQILLMTWKSSVDLRRAYKNLTSDDESENDITLGYQTHNSPDIGETSEPFQHYKFTNRSKYDPRQGIHKNIYVFCKTLKYDLNCTQQRAPYKHNFTREERLAITSLVNNPHITIKPADKGSCIVLQDTTAYIRECESQLNNTKFYKKVAIDPTPQNNTQVERLVSDMANSGTISYQVANYLIIDKPRTACFYTLPKIHKPQRPPPGRPIVSASNCPTERISGFVDHFLRPYVTDLKSYIKDTTDFLRKISQIKTLPIGHLFVTLDVTALYTNIPHMEGLSVAKTILNRNRATNLNPTNIDLIRLLSMVLKLNSFEFNGQYHTQQYGVAMGTRVAPTLANLVMGHFEDQFVYTYPLQPTFWGRYIDDIFVIWPHGSTQLHNFVSHLNSSHPTIKFTVDMSSIELPFLDVLVKRDTNGDIYTTLYTKPTDTHMYLHYSSSHPKHTINSGPYSQFLRLRCICQRNTDFEYNCKHLTQYYCNRGYPTHMVLNAKAKASTTDRDTLLNNNTQPNTTQRSDDRFFCVLTYNPANPPVKKLIQDNWHILASNNQLQPLAQRQVVIGHRRNKNLKDILINSRLRYPPTNNTTEPDNSQHILRPICTTTNCKYCSLLVKSKNITSTTTNRTYTCRENYDCKNNNLIYLLQCTRCRSQYVGETSRMLHKRLWEHIHKIKLFANPDKRPPSYSQSDMTTVARHFGKTPHTVSDLQVYVLEFINKSAQDDTTTEFRRYRESIWIHRLKTMEPFGLNVIN